MIITGYTNAYEYDIDELYNLIESYLEKNDYIIENNFISKRSNKYDHYEKYQVYSFELEEINVDSEILDYFNQSEDGDLIKIILDLDIIEYSNKNYKQYIKYYSDDICEIKIVRFIITNINNEINYIDINYEIISYDNIVKYFPEYLNYLEKVIK